MEAQVMSVPATKWEPSPDASHIVKRIHAMLHPRNIALVGATDKPGNYAERIWNNLIKYKYAGGLFPINAKRERTDRPRSNSSGQAFPGRLRFRS